MLPAYHNKAIIILALAVLLPALQACGGKKVYRSKCDGDKVYKLVGFTQLMDSLPLYDKQFVEVKGEYKEGKGQSALYNDSVFVDHSIGMALWVDFSQQCPLYLDGTSEGFFDYSSTGQLTPINNKTIIMRGEINLRYKGSAGKYKGSIDHISYISL